MSGVPTKKRKLAKRAAKPRARKAKALSARDSAALIERVDRAREERRASMSSDESFSQASLALLNRAFMAFNRLGRTELLNRGRPRQRVFTLVCQVCGHPISEDE